MIINNLPRNWWYLMNRYSIEMQKNYNLNLNSCMLSRYDVTDTHIYTHIPKNVKKIKTTFMWKIFNLVVWFIQMMESCENKINAVKLQWWNDWNQKYIFYLLLFQSVYVLCLSCDFFHVLFHFVTFILFTNKWIEMPKPCNQELVKWSANIRIKWNECRYIKKKNHQVIAANINWFIHCIAYTVCKKEETTRSKDLSENNIFVL